MWQWLSNLFDDNAKTLKKYQVIVDQINALEPTIKALTNKQLAGQTVKFKAAIQQSLDTGKNEQEALELILPEAFATVREVSRRTLGMRHFDVQLLAGIGLHYGKITEQKTGEGKTLTVTCPLYLNALLEKGAHLVTVNDYLAEVGAGWMGQIYHFLGLKTAVIIHDQAEMFDPKVQGEDRGDERLEHFQKITRQQAYLCDIVYGTNNEFGFDYLRDNMVPNLEMMVQRQDTPHFYAIVDEADSILIDEARTPLIISAPDSEPTSKYGEFARMVTSLGRDSDYTLDEKAKTATLTDLGVKRIEQKLGVKNLYEESFDTIHYVENALRAQTLYQRDKEYIVRNDQVIIVDEHTGRLMYGRRFSNGLHQAIEAKENVKVQQESRTLATISLQNYFRMYQKLAGMTGTAVTEAEEFRKVYQMDVLVIPTNVPAVRKDQIDLVYKTAAAKYSALLQEVAEIHATGRPILIGTRSIDHNQIIANLMTKKGIPHEVLNAKNNEKEAFVIAKAGEKGAITVATNIAGRGVDIVLGGAKPELKDYRLEIGKYDQKKYDAALAKWQKKNEEVVKLGGLAILGTERHESRRIDNQLRGRAGRQGDPGSSRFYVALEDDIMRIFGGEKMISIMNTLNMPENMPIEAGLISKAIENAQTKVESLYFDQRQRLVEFDDVMNKQREIIYQKRRRFLDLSSVDIAATAVNEAKVAQTTLRDEILGYLDETVATNVTAAIAGDNYAPQLISDLVKIIPFDPKSQQNLQKRLEKIGPDQTQLIQELQTLVRKTYASRNQQLGNEVASATEKQLILGTIDELWMNHLDNIEDLRQGIWLRGDKDTVLTEYKQEAFKLFAELMNTIKTNVVERIFRIQINPQALEQQRIAEAMQRAQNANLSGTANSSLAEVMRAAANQQATPATPESAAALPKSDHSASNLAAALKKQQAANYRETVASAAPMPTSAPSQKTPKVGRNDPCPCGSGKKYKKCCGAAN